MAVCLGIDTSNYTTSAAVWEPTGIEQRKKLLEVGRGEKGLRQSEAVFQHVKNLPPLLEELPGVSEAEAVGVSLRPRDAEGSYMPCFRVGECAARAVAAARGIPLYGFSHQAGHIAAALWSAGRLDLLGRPFLAFHVSGGTTEAVLAEPSEETAMHAEIVSRSLDLKAGQAVDRVGLLLGLSFPCGPALEKLADRSEKNFSPRIPFRGADFSLSGIENRCGAMCETGAPPEDVAAFCMASIGAALAGAAARLSERYPALPIVFAGGVTSNQTLRRELSGRFGAVFAEPAFSSDNAAGAAVLAAKKAGML